MRKEERGNDKREGIKTKIAYGRKKLKRCYREEEKEKKIREKNKRKMGRE